MMEEGLAFRCSRCKEKPAVVRKGRRVFLCASCASDLMWQDIVGGISDAVYEDSEETTGNKPV